MAKRSGHVLHKALASRTPAPRGEDVRVKVDAKHSQAKHAHALHLEAKTNTAARETLKAGRAQGNRLANAEKKRERGEQRERELQAANARRAQVQEEVKAKGRTEVVKVQSAVANLQETEAIVTELQKRAQAQAMLDAEERRAFELARVQARGHDELAKVERTRQQLAEETSAKVEALAAANAALADAAAERRASKLAEKKQRARAELKKVGHVAGSRPPQSPLRIGSPSSVVASTLDEPPSTEHGPRKRLPLPMLLAPPSPPPPPPPPPPALPGGASSAGLMLALLRAGVPNLEVLAARTSEELTSLGTKYSIDLGGLGGGGDPPAGSSSSSSSSSLASGATVSPYATT